MKQKVISSKRNSLFNRYTGLVGVLIVAVLFGAASYLWGDQYNVSDAAVQQRFPGDPNPLVSGKAFFGTSGNYLDDYEAAAGKSVGVYRKFNQWNTASSAANTINSNYAKNRLVWISFKTPKWSQVANGDHDGVLDSTLRALDNTGHPVWVTFWHEPENDEGNANAGSAADFVNMQRHIRQRMNALNTKNIAFAPVYQSSKIISMGSAHDNWYGSGIWDFIGFDIYERDGSKSLLGSKWTTTINWVLSKGLPYAIGEWAVRADAPSSQITDFWEWSFKNKKDMIGMSYFDSDANSVGSWLLTGANRTAFINILKNDQRVMRVTQLGSSVGGGGGTTTPPPAPAPDTTKPKVSITSPSVGAVLSGNVTVTATASDNVGVKSVTLRVDDKYVAKDTSAPYKFTFDSTKYKDGSHTIVLRAFDNADNMGETASRSIMLDNTPAPVPAPTDGGTTPKQPKPVTKIDTKKETSTEQPLEVAGTVEVTPTKPGSTVSVKVDGKDHGSTKIDTEQLTDGNHTVTVTEDGKTEDIVIKVDNPWPLAVANEVKSKPVVYGGAATAAVGSIWFFHRRLFELFGSVFGAFGR